MINQDVYSKQMRIDWKLFNFKLSHKIIGRVGMGMTTLLTVTAMFGSTRGSVPRVSYVSYLDIWMVTCIIFVFASMIEFTVVHTFYRYNRKTQGEQIEKIMRIVLAFMFLVFNLVYWYLLYIAYIESIWSSCSSHKSDCDQER